MKRTVVIFCAIVVLAGVGIFLLWPNTHPDPIADKSSATVSHRSLVSMGDSVAAGDGLTENSTTQAALCHQSIEAYPYLVAQSLHAQLHQFACSGAQITAGILQPQIVGAQSVPAQLQTATPYIAGNDVVITIGANDVGWDSFLTACAESNCVTSANQATFNARLTTLQSNLDTMLQKIAALHPHAVVVNTYYSLIANTDTCLQSYDITSAKIAWVNTQEASLNTAIITAAQKYHDKFATVTFSGHGICSSDPWMQGLSGSAPLHPTFEGQYNIATLDAAQLR
jgi:lysophospholipase L1-like esterase